MLDPQIRLGVWGRAKELDRAVSLCPMPTKVWTWRYLDAAGDVVKLSGDLAKHESVNQADAETWIGENWQELHQSKVEQVVLMHDATEIYTMGLSPSD